MSDKIYLVFLPIAMGLLAVFGQYDAALLICAAWAFFLWSAVSIEEK